MEQTETTSLEITAPRTISFKAPAGGKKVKVTHLLRPATAPEASAHDEAQPYRSKDIGNDEEEVLLNTSPSADKKLYDKLILETKGYKYNVLPGQTQEERETALSGIPTKHKRAVIRKLTTISSEVVYDNSGSEEDSDAEFEYSDNQVYRLRTEIDDVVIYTNIKELSEKQFELYSGASRFTLERGQRKPITKITVSIAPVIDIFKAQVLSIENMTYQGEPLDFTNEAKRKEYVIDPYFQRSVITALIKETEVDMGE
jgi:hypothetical protein